MTVHSAVLTRLLRHQGSRIVFSISESLSALAALVFSSPLPRKHRRNRLEAHRLGILQQSAAARLVRHSQECRQAVLALRPTPAPCAALRAALREQRAAPPWICSCSMSGGRSPLQSCGGILASPLRCPDDGDARGHDFFCGQFFQIWSEVTFDRSHFSAIDRSERGVFVRSLLRI